MANPIVLTVIFCSTMLWSSPEKKACAVLELRVPDYETCAYMAEDAMTIGLNDWINHLVSHGFIPDAHKNYVAPECHRYVPNPINE